MTQAREKATDTATPQETLDRTDRQLLDIIQTAFPLAPRPYAVLGEQLGISEEEAFTRVRALKAVRSSAAWGPTFNPPSWAMFPPSAPPKCRRRAWPAFVERVNAEPGVTHNYQREHAYNIWFTLISPSRQDAQATLDAISRDTGVDILNLPATKLFKIRVDFRMDTSADEA